MSSEVSNNINPQTTENQKLRQNVTGVASSAEATEPTTELLNVINNEASNLRLVDDDSAAVVSSWRERSFLVEMKPCGDLAALFIDCPPHFAEQQQQNESSSSKHSPRDAEFVKVGTSSLEILEDCIGKSF